VLAALLPLIVNSGKITIENLENKMKTNVLAANGHPRSFCFGTTDKFSFLVKETENDYI